MPKALFRLGQCVSTRGALALLEQLEVNPLHLLMRHHSGDWGDLDAEDRAANDQALQSGTRLLSAYIIGDGHKVWVITEADRSSTTILLPDEY